MSDLITKYVISEGVHGTYFYHLSLDGQTAVALCGKQTMSSSLHPSIWGYVGHLGERYCQECVQIGLWKTPEQSKKKE